MNLSDYQNCGGVYVCVRVCVGKASLATLLLHILAPEAATSTTILGLFVQYLASLFTTGGDGDTLSIAINNSRNKNIGILMESQSVPLVRSSRRTMDCVWEADINRCHSLVCRQMFAF